jgi:hypothetical protein
MKTVAVHSLAVTLGISYGVCQEILPENGNELFVNKGKVYIFSVTIIVSKVD